MSVLPGALRFQLEQALNQPNVDAIHRVINEIQPHDAGLAQALAMLAKDFQYDRILTLLAGADGESKDRA